MAAEAAKPHHEAQLSPVAEKLLQTKCKANTLAYCPTMDLIALATVDDDLHVFRLNGQQVIGGSFAGDPYLLGERCEIKALDWKDNGSFLAVACADNTTRIISSYSGKTIHHYSAYWPQDDKSVSQPAARSANITCLAWSGNFNSSKAAQRYMHDVSGQGCVEDLLSPDVHPAQAAALLKADLPRELALLDIECSLPKLSTLPSSGSDGDVFSARASIDAIFHAQGKDSSDTVDVLLVGFDDGTIHLRIFDCFEIGSFRLSEVMGHSATCRTLLHASHPLCSTHALLVSVSDRNGTGSSLQLVTLDLRFITKSGIYLSLLASKTTQLQNLLRYVNQTQRQIELEWKNTQEFPARFIYSIAQELREKCHCDFVTAVYHSIVTGDCFAPLKEFLVDTVGERGHKRWDKAVSNGYENVRKLTHECLLPALERCEVLLGRLIGLSKFQKLNDVLGLETTRLNGIVQTLDCLHLLAHKILIGANEELSQFAAFSKWLHHEIEVQSAEPMSQTLEELMDKSDMIDHRRTLKYVQGPLTKSVLRYFIQQLPTTGLGKPPTTASGGTLPIDEDGSFYDNFKKLLRQLPNENADGSSFKLPKLNDLTKRLGLQCERVFEHIALTQRRGILHRSAFVFHRDCDPDVIDVAMRFENTDEGALSSVYTATRSLNSKHAFYVYRVTLDLLNGVSSTRQTSVAAIDLCHGAICQIQFVDTGTLMLLWVDNSGVSYLLQFPFQPPSVRQSENGPNVSDVLLNYVAFESSPSGPEPTIAAVSIDVLSSHSQFVKHAFPATGSKARPVWMNVNGRKNRRAACVLYGERMLYEVLDIDAEVRGEDGEDDTEDDVQRED